jgi:RNA polymerase sigma-70 factor (ECF subfamily)
MMEKRTNEQWLADLGSGGPKKEAALEDLHQIILSGLPYALSNWLRPDDPRFDALVEEIAQETILRVLDHLHTFQGLSQFTTWVYKIAVRTALTELRRKRWADVSLEELVEKDEAPSIAAIMRDPSLNPEQITEGAEVMQRVQSIITEELTERQRQAIIAVSIKGMPIEEVARRMDTNRNALYKLMHDTRLKLKKRLEAENLTLEDVLSTFNQG